MFPSPLAALTVLAGLAARAAAQQTDVAVSVDFYTDVMYSPPDAWHSELNSACNTVDHYAATENASATIQFVGDRITVSGMHNNASGVLEVEVDDGIPYMLNLWSNDVECGLFVDYYLANGSHTLKLTLRNLDAILHAINETDLSNEGTILNPVLHLTDITYFVPGAFAESTPVPSAVGGVAAASSTSHKNIAAIVAGTVGGVVGLAALVLGVLFFLRKRAARKARHSFNPNTVFITELSPRTATTPDSAAKFGTYAQMDDDVETKSVDVKTGGLAVPELHYSAPGLRARSRSPAPDRKPMP